MGLFSGRKPHSGLVAKERLSNLLMAERLNCSPASLQMLKNDLAATAIKYFFILYFLFRDLVTFGDITKDPLPFVFAEGLFNYLPPAGRWSSQYLAIVIRKCRVVPGRS